MMIEIATKCRVCGNAVAINGVVQKIDCSFCGAGIFLPNETWLAVFKEILGFSKSMIPNEAIVSILDDQSAGRLRFVFKKTKPICENCRKPLEFNISGPVEQNLEHCDTRIHFRKFPDFGISYGLGGFLLNEDIYLLQQKENISEETALIELSCTNCGAPLKTEGKKRHISCSFCKTELVLPDQVWQCLHPSSKIKPFYYLYESATVDTLKTFIFREIIGMVCDENDILYCIGETANDTYALWAMNGKCELIWMSVIPEDKRWPDYFKEIELGYAGNLILWNREVHAGLVYEKSTGIYTGETGGPEPVSAKVHQLDFYHMDSFAPDPDGSFVGLIGWRILRFNKEGKGIYLWPKSVLDFQRISSIYKRHDKEPQDRTINDMRTGNFILSHQLKNKTIHYSYISPTTIFIDKNRNHYLLASFKEDNSRHIRGGAILTRFDQMGKIRFKKELGAFDVNKVKARVDSTGNIYVVMNDAREKYEHNGRIIRISPSGEEIKVVAKFPFMYGITSHGCWTVGSNGIVYTIGNQNQMRVFDQEGGIIWRNSTAIEFDKKIMTEIT